MELSGAEIVIRCLQAEKVEYVLGYPGGAVLFIYDELFKQDKVKHVLVRHEQGATHAADGYSRSSDKIGVALVTSGPGVTNAVTGIATAYMDSIPMVIITGQVPTHAIGLDAFQECDTVGITRPCVKHNFLVKDVRDLAVTMKKAFYLAKTGRPGPVLVDIPKDVTSAKCAFEYPETVTMRSYNPVVKGHPGQIKKAVQLLTDAKRPMVYTGGGVILSNASKQLTKLVKMLGFPCTNTLMGLGGYPATDPQFLGMLGMHGTYEANMAMQNCDVLLAVGARFDDRVIGNPAHFAQVQRKIIHIDIDPSSISKRVKVDVPIVGNVSDVLEELTRQLEAAGYKPDQKALSVWWSQIGLWKSKDCLKYDKKSTIIKPQFVSSGSTRLPAARHSSLRMSDNIRCGRRSSTSSTSRGAGSIPEVWARWVSAFLRPWACNSPIPERPSRALPARRASRCASRSCPPASNTACRSRSSTSTTNTWEWCASGSNSTTATAIRSPTWTLYPISSSSQRASVTLACVSKSRETWNRLCARRSSVKMNWC